MKENIKEDIKTVEYNMKCIRNVMNNFEDELCENMQTKTDEISKIIDNILSDYKRVLEINEVLLKENKELKNQEATARKINELLVQRYSNSISVQKVKDIIDRIDYDIKKTKKTISNGRKNDYQIVRLRAMNTKSLDIQERLQDLIKEREEEYSGK